VSTKIDDPAPALPAADLRGVPASPRARLIEKAIYAGMALTVVGTLVLLGLNATHRLRARSAGAGATAGAAELARYGEVPDFELLERSGGRFGSRELRGSLYVADFIFTSCSAQCVGLSDRMAKLQAELPQRPDVKLVSFTIDPKVDTPERLREYAERFHAQVGRWFFLTGDEAVIRKLSIEGFKLGVTAGASEAATDIDHTPRLVLVDQAGAIRGWYDANDAQALAALARDVHALLR
jgi:protein SCO1/2